MALKKCPDCGKPVSPRAKICNHCGRPNPGIAGCWYAATGMYFLTGLGVACLLSLFPEAQASPFPVIDFIFTILFWPFVLSKKLVDLGIVNDDWLKKLTEPLRKG